jgi:hypothetical protein
MENVSFTIKHCVYRLPLPGILPLERSMEIKEVMKELNLVALDLARLSGSVAAFADWWGTMVTKLATLESGVNRLKPQPGKNVARIELLRKDWEDIEHKYEDYRNDVCVSVDIIVKSLTFPIDREAKV